MRDQHIHPPNCLQPRSVHNFPCPCNFEMILRDITYDFFVDSACSTFGQSHGSAPRCPGHSKLTWPTAHQSHTRSFSGTMLSPCTWLRSIGKLSTCSRQTRGPLNWAACPGLCNTYYHTRSIKPNCGWWCREHDHSQCMSSRATPRGSHNLLRT